jgi:hypothetical protein
MKTPFDCSSSLSQEEKTINQKRLKFLLEETREDPEYRCIVCNNVTTERSIFIPPKKYRHKYGLDDELVSIIYAVCENCSRYVNVIEIQDRIKNLTRSENICLNM